MPRPPKHVPPDTLGGHIRAARERLNLSLANVAAGRYSTSLISQIERNRVEPSQESLEFLAEKLQLPLEDLRVLAEQNRESEAEVRRYKAYEALRIETSQLLMNRLAQRALDQLKVLTIAHIPPSLRWRLAALRGQCYFTQRQFLAAQKDFLYAVTDEPEVVPTDQRQEAMTLHLHLAAAHRELEQPDPAFEQYQIALNMMDANTSLLYIAEAHWGMSLIAFERANKVSQANSLDGDRFYKESQLRTALNHAENACILYRSVGEMLRAALLSCQIGLIEQAMGNFADARQHLLEVLNTWLPTLDEQADKPTVDRRLKEHANVVSAVACSLAGIELEAHDYQAALAYVHQAQRAGKLSYIIRRAEAEMMLGRILEAINLYDPAIEEAFRAAIKELASTDRVAARIRAHGLLGLHLVKKGDLSAGEAELDQIRKLSHFVSSFSNITISTEEECKDGSS